MRRELTSVRDTVESISVAIVLALVLRAFLVEAFVIPTGSMAPRLLGEHWDLVCPACGYNYAFGGPRIAPEQAVQFDRAQRYVPLSARCPNCRKPFNDTKEFLSGGDRVLVLKYLYHFRPPQPFDVVVFRNPQNNRENYIKRLIGLPGETLEIVHGDVFVSSTPDGPRQIRRKPPVAQEAMWQEVFDNDYQPDPDYSRGVRSPRWVASGEECWRTDAFQRRFTYSPGASSAGELAFQADATVFLPHYGYNSADGETVLNPKVDVCTDLRLSVEFMPADPYAAVALGLSSFDDRFRGEVCADGVVKLLHRKSTAADERWELWSQAKLPPLKIGQGYEVALINVDLSLKLAVDGKVVLEVTDGYPQNYRTLKDRLRQAEVSPVPTPQVGITAWGGACELRHLRLMRDVYYTGLPLSPPTRGPLSDYARQLENRKLLSLEDRAMTGWGTTDHPITLARHEDNPDLDEFFVLGDNSPQSLDSRGWTWAAPTLRLYQADSEGITRPVYQLGTVPRYNLIGKAFFVYWPAGFRPPGLPGLPIVPSFGKMRFVH
jgi:signal peptidase I